MRFHVFDALQQIQSKWPIEAPKIFEKLLAISFDPKRGGFQVESKSTEGVDICLVGVDCKYAVEVKTTTGFSVLLQDKDVQGLYEKSRKDGYLPCVAALRLELMEDWIVAHAGRLTVGQYTPARLSLDSLPDLESVARKHFEKTAAELLEGVLSPPGGAPLNFLASVLANESS